MARARTAEARDRGEGGPRWGGMRLMRHARRPRRRGLGATAARAESEAPRTWAAAMRTWGYSDVV